MHLNFHVRNDKLVRPANEEGAVACIRAIMEVAMMSPKIPIPRSNDNSDSAFCYSMIWPLIHILQSLASAFPSLPLVARSAIDKHN